MNNSMLGKMDGEPTGIESHFRASGPSFRYRKSMKDKKAHVVVIEEMMAAVREICAGLPIARVEAFGSVARGEARPDSDIDLLVEFLPNSHPGLFEMGALKEDLEERLQRPVDLLSRKAVEKSKNPYRRAAILKDRVTLYAR